MSLGSNDTLRINTLAGKSILLIQLTTMCRLGDVQQLQISQMLHENDTITFSLLIPTKTYNNKTYRRHPQLQFLTIQSFHNDKLLCLVTTLTDYIVRTKEARMGLDKIFVCVGPDPKETKLGTISRWTKQLMAEAGLSSYTLHSTRGSSATCALLM